MREDKHRINDGSEKKIRHETQKLSTAMVYFEMETKQDILQHNSKINSVNVRLCQQMPNAKESQMGILTEFA